VARTSPPSRGWGFQGSLISGAAGRITTRWLGRHASLHGGYRRSPASTAARWLNFYRIVDDGAVADSKEAGGVVRGDVENLDLWRGVAGKGGSMNLRQLFGGAGGFSGWLGSGGERLKFAVRRRVPHIYHVH
jgi:hypothetical protein